MAPGDNAKMGSTGTRHFYTHRKYPVQTSSDNSERWSQDWSMEGVAS